MKRLLGNVTIITGGGKGIGFGLAEAFAQEGSNLVITVIKVSGGHAL